MDPAGALPQGLLQLKELALANGAYSESEGSKLRDHLLSGVTRPVHHTLETSYRGAATGTSARPSAHVTRSEPTGAERAEPRTPSRAERSFDPSAEKVARGFKSHPRRSTLFEKRRTERSRFWQWPVSKVRPISPSTGD